MTPRFWTSFLLLVVLSGCGRYYAGGQPARPPAPPTPTPTNFVSGKRTGLYVFGAGFCSKCKTQFPDLNRRLGELTSHERGLLNLKLYYVAGDPSNVRPTQDLADGYRENYLPLAVALPDLPWRWFNFKALLPDVKLDVPAAVVLDENDQVIKRYPAGDTTFVPAEIASFVEARLKAQ